MKGKAYANRLPKHERPTGDFYATPRSLVRVAESVITQEFKQSVRVLDPCDGADFVKKESDAEA